MNQSDLDDFANFIFIIVFLNMALAMANIFFFKGLVSLFMFVTHAGIYFALLYLGEKI